MAWWDVLSNIFVGQGVGKDEVVVEVDKNTGKVVTRNSNSGKEKSYTTRSTGSHVSGRSSDWKDWMS